MRLSGDKLAPRSSSPRWKRCGLPGLHIALFCLLLHLSILLPLIQAFDDSFSHCHRVDHSIVAVTVDGHVHTLDAWTGAVRGVFADGGGPLVSSSTTIGRGQASTNEGGEDERDGPRSSGNIGAALGGSLVIPGLDGVIYTLGPDGRLSVLLTSAPDLVLQPQMACLAVAADLNGIVEEEGCGLLVGEKTTQLFNLNTVTGEAQRMGTGMPNDCDTSAPSGEKGWSSACGGGGNNGKPSTEQIRNPNHVGDEGDLQSDGHLLLQRDEYVVRAFDTTTSVELWNMTVAHFNALDLQGRGGASALTRAKSASPQPDISHVSAGGGGGSIHFTQPEVLGTALLPGPKDWSSTWDENKEYIEGREGCGDECDAEQRRESSTAHEGDSSETGEDVMGGGKRASRFPYFLYEDNTWVVALDPWDFSVLWRREMPSLAVALYGIQGNEWVEIMPPPMSIPQHPFGGALVPSIPLAGVDSPGVLNRDAKTSSGNYMLDVHTLQLAPLLRVE
ncbi:unnamed protein product, partial [Choristocarpus tenellus]